MLFPSSLTFSLFPQLFIFHLFIPWIFFECLHGAKFQGGYKEALDKELSNDWKNTEVDQTGVKIQGRMWFTCLEIYR